MQTPASQSPGCRVAPGRVVRAYETEAGTQYHGGTAYDQHLVFAPSDGGTALDVGTGRFYAPQPQPQPGPAVAEYVDGEIDYIATGAARVGPVFDPATDADPGWILIGLGAFFLLLAAFVAVLAYLQGRRTRGPHRLRS